MTINHYNCCRVEVSKCANCLILTNNAFNDEVDYLGDDFASYTFQRHGNVNVKLSNGDEKFILDVLYILDYTKNLFLAKQLDKARVEKSM